jgi:hypothetical protein
MYLHASIDDSPRFNLGIQSDISADQAQNLVAPFFVAEDNTSRSFRAFDPIEASEAVGRYILTRSVFDMINHSSSLHSIQLESAYNVVNPAYRHGSTERCQCRPTRCCWVSHSQLAIRSRPDPQY